VASAGDPILVSRKLQTFLIAIGLAFHVSAKVLTEGRAVQSQSGQFVVSRVPGGVRTPAVSALATNEEFLELETTLLVVSCERIKQAVAHDLGLTAPWRGKICIRLRTATGANDPITVVRERSRDRWDYLVELPDVVERAQLMRVLVEVMLLETANQQAGGRTAELPPWLAVGLAERLLSASEVSLLFPPPQVRVGTLALGPTVAASRQVDPLATARVRLRERLALTLQGLSWPTERDFSGETSAAYRASAQLFVSELLRLPDGDACFRALLGELPNYFNWQTAFLKAFHAHFERLLDLEKWWSLQSVAIVGRDPGHIWSVAESWLKLDEALHVPGQVRAAPDQLPSGAVSITLQTIVSDWDTMHQAPALQDRLQQFDLLRQRLAPELLPLLADYRRVLANYLEQQTKLGISLARGQAGRPGIKRLIVVTVQQLNQLDQRAKAMRAEAPAVAPPTNPAPNQPSS